MPCAPNLLTCVTHAVILPADWGPCSIAQDATFLAQDVAFLAQYDVFLDLTHHMFNMWFVLSSVHPCVVCNVMVRPHAPTPCLHAWGFNTCISIKSWNSMPNVWHPVLLRSLWAYCTCAHHVFDTSVVMCSTGLVCICIHALPFLCPRCSLNLYCLWKLYLLCKPFTASLADSHYSIHHEVRWDRGIYPQFYIHGILYKTPMWISL